tara:strand:+ start:3609 stop:3851 length:243 start_codon:yes stop_codon:yes gene_type:complete
MYVIIITLLIVGAVKEIREIIFDILDLSIIIPIRKIYKLVLLCFDQIKSFNNNQFENPIENYTSNNLELRIINCPSYDEL